MAGVLTFVAAVIWGSLAARFLLQTVTSLTVTGISLAALGFSNVSKETNLIGSFVGFMQTILFAILFAGGGWLANQWIDYTTWSANSIASLVAFVASAAYVAPQVPGKILLARMCAWVPSFFEESISVPRSERIEFARKQQAMLAGR